MVRAIRSKHPASPRNGIVAEIPIRHRKRVASIRPGGIGGGGDRHALIEISLRVVLVVGSKLREQPAIGQLVIEHNRVAGILSLTLSAEACPDRIAGDRAKNRCRCFGCAVQGPHLVAHIDHLHVLVVAY